MLKRVFDILCSFLGLLLLFPFLVVIGIWIILDSKGGMFYIQSRVGEAGKDFALLKFRTMYIESDKTGLLTVGNSDKRITQAGIFLRKYKLDELPQLLNVLMGDMSLVGPRPEVRKYVELYTSEQKKVLSVKPGITDPASLEFSNENQLLAEAAEPEKYYVEHIMPQKISLSLQYVKQRNFSTDLKIIFRTLDKVFT